MEKRQILVAGAFTNGEAAGEKIRQLQGWSSDDSEFVYCNGNTNVVERLMHGPTFAVVPVFNSLLGREIPEVVEALRVAERAGYTFRKITEFDLLVSHCLMAPRFVDGLGGVTKVMSHIEALNQCANYLDRIGIHRESRFECCSTGAAAERVARLRPDDDEYGLAAIAPQLAAERLGLRILEKIIHEDPSAYTTFIMLEHT